MKIERFEDIIGWQKASLALRQLSYYRPFGTPYNSRLYDIFGLQINFIYLN
jgi:hypothetical protein